MYPCFPLLSSPWAAFSSFPAEAQQIDKPDLIQSFPVGASPRGLAFDGANIWITSDTIPNLTKLRASDGASLGTFPAGGKTAFAVFDGTYVWVTNLNDDTVSRLRASDGTLRDVPSRELPLPHCF
jgi:DNA-binding beta-propeller fold protein YncE